MNFLNKTQNVIYDRKNDLPKNNIPNMFQMTRRIIPPPVVQQQIQPESEPEAKKMLWGPAIWFFFHTLAEKVKEESFSSIKAELLNNIYAISVNLPCPMCATHAKEYLDKINFNSIQCKDDLKNMLFQFHNEVNKRKNYPLFSRDELDEKYSKAVTVNIIKNFMFFFKDRSRSPKLIANDLQRTRIATILNTWFSTNIQHFYL
jgi:hypothetical protein